MTNFKQSKRPVWKALIRHAEVMNRPENHLKYLVESNDRLSKFSLEAAGIFYDFSRQRLDEKVMDLLFE
ncbi:MAG: glucose-6-phosphate isomerase, partial [Desulfobacteraceae bacterium]|nr:glucose-6-phosphate isomerase [Desulfobacteraceae bacterium]